MRPSIVSRNSKPHRFIIGLSFSSRHPKICFSPARHTSTRPEKKLGLPERISKFEDLSLNDLIEVLLRHERAPRLSQGRISFPLSPDWLLSLTILGLLNLQCSK